MKIIAEKALDKIVEMYPLLKNIELKFEEYQEGTKFDPETSEYHHYAKLNVKRFDGEEYYYYDIDLYTNMIEYFGEFIYQDLNKVLLTYFDSLQIEFNNQNLLIFNLLHELGHVLMYENFKKDTGTYNKLLGYDEASNNIIDIIFSDGCIFNPIDKYHFHELHAEKFAYSTFPIVIASL